MRDYNNRSHFVRATYHPPAALQSRLRHYSQQFRRGVRRCARIVRSSERLPRAAQPLDMQFRRAIRAAPYLHSHRQRIHTGSQSLNSLLLRLRGLLPSASIIQICRRPVSRFEKNTIWLPSGDQLGCLSHSHELNVSRVGSPPSGLTT